MRDLTECVLHLGSNEGFKHIYLELAEVLISNLIGDVISVSETYVTEPWGKKDQDVFLNKALICHTQLKAQDVLLKIHVIENRLGRRRELKWGPRSIDIDIIFYGDKIIKNDNLKIPHTQLTNRNFVLTPLMDICPEKMHPELNKSVRQLNEECKDTGEVSSWVQHK